MRERCLFFLGVSAVPLGLDECDGLDDGGLQVAVDEEGVVDAAGVGDFHLTSGLAEAALDGAFVFAFALSEAVQECLLVGGEDEDGHGRGVGFVDVDGALDVYFEDDQSSLSEALIDPGFGGAVAFTKDACVFEELAFGDHGVKLCVVDEVVVESLAVGIGFGSGGGRDGEDGLGDVLFECAGDGGFADAAGAGDDQEHAEVPLVGYGVGRWALGHRVEDNRAEGRGRGMPAGAGR